jgi:hypothetical protein
MADVRPLRGIRYNREIVDDLARVITPPFDVISLEAQERYYARDPYNVIRLELGRESASDTTLDNRYTRSAAAFGEWRAVLRSQPQRIAPVLACGRACGEYAAVVVAARLLSVTCTARRGGSILHASRICAHAVSGQYLAAVCPGLGHRRNRSRRVCRARASRPL